MSVPASVVNPVPFELLVEQFFLVDSIWEEFDRERPQSTVSDEIFSPLARLS
ncbi:hypothetical protein [Halosimplex carlsbadense]|uniref:hypothetical protein n=1 Tax=Halosimplex carlsbadense TaxID=171164 RepID=UPI0013790F44|nr:hypothetical protein [Halosimplex carlsbadense]